MTVDADKYRERIVQIKHVFQPVITDQAAEIIFTPRPGVGWRIDQLVLTNTMAIATALYTIFSEDPATSGNLKTFPWIKSMIPPGEAYGVVANDAPYFNQVSYWSSPVIIPAGGQLRIRIGTDAANFEVPGTQVIEGFGVEIPAQESWEIDGASSVTTFP